MFRTKKHLENILRIGPLDKKRRDFLRLDMNENICEIPAEFIKQTLMQIDSDFLSSYPDLESLYESLAEHLGLNTEKLLLTNGSDSAAKLIADTFISAGDSVLLMNPGFAMHAVYASMNQARIVQIDYDSSFAFPFAQIMAAISSQVSLVILVNPVNPFGTLLSREQAEQILTRALECQCLVYMDEAYMDFVGTGFFDLLKDFPNLLISRTFSKAYGMAALRIGYVAADPQNINALRLTQPTYDVNAVAALFARELICNPDILASLKQQMLEGYEVLAQELRLAGIEFHSGAGNFCLIKVGAHNRESLKQRLKERHKILVSSKAGSGLLEDYIRISLGPKDKMRAFSKALQTELQGDQKLVKCQAALQKIAVIGTYPFDIGQFL